MKLTFEDISVFLAKRFFSMRFLIAKVTRKSKLYKTIIDKLFLEGDEIYIIPNDNRLTKEISLNVSIPSSEDTVLPTTILREMIEKSNHIVIMDYCLCRTSNKCDDYPQDLGCIFLGENTKNISRKHCHDATVEEALLHVDKCAEVGLTHLIGRNKIDSVWTNSGPKEDLLTICNCCPCCCLWKLTPALSDDLSSCIKPLPGVHLDYDAELCTGCGKCLDNCFLDAISLSKDKCISIDTNVCRKCGKCSDVCPSNALKISFEEYAVDDILNRLDSLVDVTK